MNTSAVSPTHALLIGVDCYLPNKLPGGSYYPHLGGCVRDVTHVETFLRTRLDVPDERIARLTASVGPDGCPTEPEARWPTYANMVAAFRRLGETARPGDRVYVHYSGHGGRARTIFPDVKGENGVDEALVPTDIGNSEVRYLRDMEMAYLLDDLVRRDLVVTVVLDSCHSGGMTRGRAAAVARGIGTVDTTERPTDSLVATPAELAETWRGLTAAATRNVSLGSGWLPEPQGYTLLAACRPSESAYEYAFDGVERNGALTYWLLHALQDLAPGLTYKTVHDRVLARVHGQFEAQTPLLQGEGDRVVFGVDRVIPVHAAVVIRVEDARVLVGTGQGQGIRKGAQFALYPPGTRTFEPAGRLGVATVTELGATESWARLETQPAAPIEPGAEAMLLGAGSVQLLRYVRLLRDERPAGAREAIDAVAAMLKAKGSGWVEAAAGDAAKADYQVGVTDAGAFEILDDAGAPVANLRPVLQVADAGAATGVVGRLVHLAKFRAAREMENHDPLSPLAGKLTVQLAGRQAEYDPADRPQPVPLADAGNAVQAGEWVFLRIRNKSRSVLNVTVLDLQPDWGISQMYPTGSGDLFVPLDPGEEKLLPLHAQLPDGYEEGQDVIKVFATIGTSNFRILELPTLDQPLRSARLQTRSERSQQVDPLEQLLEAVSANRPKTRQLVPAAYPSHEWVTATVPVTIKRSI